MTQSLALTGACVALVGLAFAAALPPPPPMHRYAEDPPLAHTGGFGEPTCHTCHFDASLNAPGGSLALTGVPDAYTPGTSYRITVRLQREDLRRAGFELAARFPDGAQAGSLRADDAAVAVTATDTTGVQYAHHTAAGTDPATPDSARWTLVWTAPTAAPRDSVVFHAAANAANDDASEFGDFIYTAERASNASDDGE